MPVEVLACAVVAHGGARAGAGGGLLDVAERDAGVEGGGDERVAQGMRADGLGDPARRVTLRTTRAAPCLSSRLPSGLRNSMPTDLSGDGEGMVLTDSAGSWTAAEAPLPANASAGGSNGLESVSCSSASQCVAVGDCADASGRFENLVLTFG